MATTSLAQKVKVGYDKSVDFSRYKTYTWAKPTMPISRPALYAVVEGSIDEALTSKGLKRVEKDGDLVLISAGGIEYGVGSAAATPIPSTYAGVPVSFDATMWTGGSANLTNTYVPKGTLQLQFVDPHTNKILWNGTVSEKLDSQKKKESMERIQKAVTKLIQEFPPSAAPSK
jgi:hypothetical protein